MHAHYDIPGPFGVLMEVMLIGIILGYIMIALQFWLAGRAQGPARTATKQLFAIFILCALCGYAPRLVHFPNWLIMTLHGLLVIATWTYAQARQAVVISNALDAAGDRAELADARS